MWPQESRAHFDKSRYIFIKKCSKQRLQNIKAVQCTSKQGNAPKITVEMPSTLDWQTYRRLTMPSVGGTWNRSAHVLWVV
jgi:hypothetical protein